MSKVYRASRYGKGSDDYINCPMNREEYHRFFNELISAKTAELKGFEKTAIFEGCMPIEIMAGRGEDTIRFGPMKPVGLPDPSTGREPYAVVQLRTEDAAGTLYNLVGFQTNLKFGEQKRVFSLIPGLENADFVRYGVMHRNTFINSPGLLDATYRMIKKPEIYFAGQITGVEGYVESASSGLTAGINAAIRNKNPGDGVVFPPNTAIGALSEYVSSSASRNFQPMNVNFGIFKDIDIPKVKSKKDRNAAIAEQSLKTVAILADRLKPRRGAARRF
jgi:methylenetetrahydrofolate--tRNA-(uracil-5-)-methyltransferase